MNGIEIKKNRQKFGLTQEQLAKKIGVSERTIINYENGETIPKTKYEIFHSVFKTLDENIGIVNEPQATYQRIQKKTTLIPLIPIEAMAGYGEGESTVGIEDITEGYNIPDFSEKGVRYMIRVSGSSMYPKYSNGDLLGCKPINDLSFIQWGKSYVLDTDQGAIVKRIFPVEGEPEIFECRSDNAEKYPPFKIHKKSIYRIAIVVGVLRLE